MQRHSFDVISFLFGAAFVVAATWVLVTDGNLDLVDGRWVWPGLLLLGGVLLLASIVTKPKSNPSPFLEASDSGDADEAARIEEAKAELPEDPFSRRGS